MAQTTSPRCGADQYLQMNINSNPNIVNEMQAIEEYTLRWMATHDNPASLRETITIPVVVHVVWKNEEENISLAQIESQIDILNKDFRKLNIELPNVPNEFQDRIADVELEFCLASKAPNGQITNGITYTQTNINSIGDTDAVMFSNMGGDDSWGRDKYLNIWVAKLSSGIFGRATRPGEATSPEVDGVVIDPRYFGSEGLAAENAPFNLGRTATHEVGHYFNLQHPWGPEDGICSEDDGVDDTPKQGWSHSGCPSHPQQSCSTDDLFMNFMEYVHDSCLMMFTEGQKLRMRSTLMPGGFRATLTDSDGCQIVSTTNLLPKNSFELFPNPANNQVQLNFKNTFSSEINISIIDLLGKQIYQTELSHTQNHIIPTQHLENGIYLIRLETTEGFLVKKLLISK